jgi:uncharacterized tellurite resistance protein B-like protein
MDRVMCILSYLPASRQVQNNKATESEKIMAIADLRNVLKIFGGSEVSEEEQNELFKEVLLMTLARAANADINIQTVEVERIAEILKERTGQEFSLVDIRVAARAELYAESTLRKYLASVRRKLSEAERAEVMRALADVFRIDQTVSVLEVDFYNRVAVSLQVAPSNLADLVAGDTN